MSEMESQAGWKWYGYAGHLIVGPRCAYHLCTRVGGYLISTVGDYRPDGRARDTIGSGPDDFYETYVFRCDGDDKDGNPCILSWGEIDGERYAESTGAERGHYLFCHKYAALTPTPDAGE